MALPLPFLLSMATHFLPVIGSVLSAAAGKRGDIDMSRKISDMVDEIGGSPEGLTGGEYAEVTISGINANRAAIEHAAETAQAEVSATAQINADVAATMRASLHDTDKYRRRWRPTLAYVLAMLVGVGGLAIIYAFTWTARFAPDNLAIVTAQIAALLEATQEPLRMVLGLLGAAVITRSVDKLLSARTGARNAQPPSSGGAPDEALRVVRALARGLSAKG